MGSPRYLAEHMLMPRFLREQGAPAVLDAIERNDADFFIPVWMDAGFRFTPKLVYRTLGELRLGVLTLPTPRQTTEAYLAAVVGKTSDPSYLRYLLWEASERLSGDAPRSVIGEWTESAHRNHGEGPPFTGMLVDDCTKFTAHVVRLCTI
jgi:hypothetical protein